jgi:hypothetical protein
VASQIFSLGPIPGYGRTACRPGTFTSAAVGRTRGRVGELDAGTERGDGGDEGLEWGAGVVCWTFVGGFRTMVEAVRNRFYLLIPREEAMKLLIQQATSRPRGTRPEACWGGFALRSRLTATNAGSAMNHKWRRTAATTDENGYQRPTNPRCCSTRSAAGRVVV